MSFTLEQQIEKIDALLAFLPFAENQNNTFAEWQWIEFLQKNRPSYVKPVKQFFITLSQEFWLDFRYDPVLCGQWINDEQVLNNANLEQLRSLLTFCLKGELKCDGFWEGVFKTGKITLLLRRLQAIKATLIA